MNLHLSNQRILNTQSIKCACLSEMVIEREMNINNFTLEMRCKDCKLNFTYTIGKYFIDIILYDSYYVYNAALDNKGFKVVLSLLNNDIKGRVITKECPEVVDFENLKESKEKIDMIIFYS